jgi:VWFA-related protein
MVEIVFTAFQHCAIAFAVLCACAVLTPAQEQVQKPASDQPNDVVRVTTELVQTTAMVFDKSGRFVPGLKREQFQLLVDGKSQPVSFFEFVVSGSNLEETKIAALSGNKPSPSKSDVPPVVRGRTIIFFIDDLHLSLDSLARTRLALTHFIDNKMGMLDQVAIASPSGRIGFLQQLTNNRVVLRAAVSRLQHQAYTVLDTEYPAMSEYMALKIEERDRDAIGYYVGRCLKENPGYTPGKCVEVVRDRARQILRQASAVTSGTLSSLESLMRSSEQIPGRKIVLLISDGFYLSPRDRQQNSYEELARITDTARRTGTVIYSIDARGLISGQSDATRSLVDGNGVLDRANIGEIPASQDALNALAADTGGRALRNSNSISGWVTQTLEETSNYYLLAWRPENEAQKSKKFQRVELSIKDHPELAVRFSRGYFNAERPSARAGKSSSKSGPVTTTDNSSSLNQDLQTALTNFSPTKSLPTLLSVKYLDTPDHGPVLTASMQVRMASLNGTNDSTEPVAVDLAGVVLNDLGKQAASFKTRVTLAPLPSDQTDPDRAAVIYEYRTPIKPGIYQVRVAARHSKSERVGSAMQWIEIPDLSSAGLALSSLLFDVEEVKSSRPSANTQVQSSVDRRFRRTAPLKILVFVYNAARGSTVNARPNISVRARVLGNNGREIATTSERKPLIGDSTDFARIPCSVELNLNSLSSGNYVLEVIVLDRITGRTTSQLADFAIE